MKTKEFNSGLLTLLLVLLLKAPTQVNGANYNQLLIL